MRQVKLLSELETGDKFYFPTPQKTVYQMIKVNHNSNKSTFLLWNVHGGNLRKEPNDKQIVFLKKDLLPKKAIEILEQITKPSYSSNG